MCVSLALLHIYMYICVPTRRALLRSRKRPTDYAAVCDAKRPAALDLRVNPRGGEHTYIPRVNPLAPSDLYPTGPHTRIMRSLEGLSAHPDLPFCVSSCRVLCGVVLVVCLCVWPVSLHTDNILSVSVTLFLSCVCDVFLCIPYRTRDPNPALP